MSNLDKIFTIFVDIQGIRQAGYGTSVKIVEEQFTNSIFFLPVTSTLYQAIRESLGHYWDSSKYEQPIRIEQAIPRYKRCQLSGYEFSWIVTRKFETTQGA